MSTNRVHDTESHQRLGSYDAESKIPSRHNMRGETMSNDEHVSMIADVFPEAVCVPVYTVEVGDFVFDPTGGRHALVSVSCVRGRVWLVRDDGRASVHQIDSTITVVRGVS